MSALDNGLKHVIQAGIDRANQVTVQLTGEKNILKKNLSLKCWNKNHAPIVSSILYVS